MWFAEPGQQMFAIGSRQNMLSVISGVVDVVGCGCGVAVFRGGMMGVFSFW